MKLSIIVPVFNMAAEGKLEYCLNSLVKQTISDYEIITVDDCSTNNSLEILKNYLRFTSYTAEHVAKILAFPSAAAMLAFFKYHTDMTPNEFRKHICQNELKKQ